MWITRHDGALINLAFFRTIKTRPAKGVSAKGRYQIVGDKEVLAEYDTEEQVAEAYASITKALQPVDMGPESTPKGESRAKRRIQAYEPVDPNFDVTKTKAWKRIMGSS